ncbi:NAD(P)/FAD-dependent oxidoreductase [Syntrophomonas erecta]
MTVLVVGAGPAGLMAAAVAAQAGAQVLLLEKKNSPGRKLKITGKGRCNITSALEGELFMGGYAGNGRFLYSALQQFTSRDLMEFFTSRGLELKVERGQRVFPVTDNADDVLRILLDNAIKSGVKIMTSHPVQSILAEEGRVKGVLTGTDSLMGDAVVIATGGLSYPGTGSTGDGYGWARDLGHRIIEPRPGLVPLVCAEEWVKELQGLSLKNVKASAYSFRGQKINEDFGEMLFTHFGVSGPIILSMSRDIGDHLIKDKKVKLSIDLKPALTEEQLDSRLQRDLYRYSRRQFKNSLDDLLPRKLIPVMIKLSQIDSEKPTHQVTRQERHRLVELFKDLAISIVATRPVAEAIVTAGGVAVKEVNPGTMESRLVKGLYFAGEILDVDGYTGGFNLQAAFSTGYVAGKHAAITDLAP